MKLNFPTILTLSRIAVIPVFTVFFVLGYYQICTWLFVAAAITDWLDGFLARRFNQTSRFGAFLDPVADKLMVTVVLVLLVFDTPETFIPKAVVAFSAMIIIGREITVSALREWMAESGERSKVAVSYIGKVKTVMQLVALPFMIHRTPMFNLPVADIGVVLLIGAVILTIWSMFIYLKGAWPSLKRGAES